MVDNKVDIISAAFDYLKSIGKAHKQQDIAERMSVSKANVSRAMNGDERYLTNRFMLRFNTAFGDVFNPEWLLTGEGEMLKPTEGAAPGGTAPPSAAKPDSGDPTLDRLLAMMEKLIEQGQMNAEANLRNARANERNTDNLARLIERWDAMQGDHLPARQGVG